mgnify:CR=1 FL=1
MQTKSLVKSLEKAGLTVIKDGRVYFCEGATRNVRWVDQAGYAVCVKVQHKGDEDDSQIDYVPGFFAHTIKEVVSSLTNKYKI